MLRSEGGTRTPGAHRKRQAMRLAAPVVGVLAEDDDPHSLGRRERQCAQRLRRKDAGARFQPLAQKRQQLHP
jgi:hypothetical protein